MNKILVMALLLFFGGGVSVASGISSSLNEGFGKTDVNSDGVISISEISATSELAKKFDVADKDSNGGISLSEYQSFFALAEAE